MIGAILALTTILSFPTPTHDVDVINFVQSQKTEYYEAVTTPTQEFGDGDCGYHTDGEFHINCSLDSNYHNGQNHCQNYRGQGQGGNYSGRGRHRR